MGSLTTSIVLSLAFDFHAEAYICADMWFGVTVETPLVPDGLWIECDWPGDGLAALWEQLADKFPERVSVKADASAARVRVMERISIGLLAQYERAESTYREHRAAAHRDANDCPPCEDCEVFLSLMVTAHRTLDDAWGASTLDKAVKEAFG